MIALLVLAFIVGLVLLVLAVLFASDPEGRGAAGFLILGPLGALLAIGSVITALVRIAIWVVGRLS